MSRVVAVLVLLATLGAAASGWLLFDSGVASRSLAGLQGDARRGAYLARLAGCVSCHTDTAGSGAFLGGGPAIETAYGTFYAPNITSDVNFGIGAWTIQQFADALTAGRAPDGRHYYPVFPYRVYDAFSDQDIVDLWAAFQTTTPSQTDTPAHRLNSPLIGQQLIGAWKKLAAFDPSIIRDPSRSAAWNRGAFIATGPGLCAQCHSPRNVLGAVAADRMLTGGIPPGHDVSAGALQPAALERRGWTRESLKTALRTGRGPNGKPFESPMKEIVRTSTSHLDDDDMDGLVEFLTAVR